MTRTFRIAVLPVAEKGFIHGPALDRAIDEMFVANANGLAVFQFWNQVTDGHLVIQPTRLPWAELPRPFAESDVTVAQDFAKITRATLLPLLNRAVSGLAGMANGGLGTYDGLVYLLFPAENDSIVRSDGTPVQFQFEGGNAAGGQLPTAILPVGMPDHSHTFLTHEVGHLFGFSDSQGIFVWNSNSQSWDSGYGDPLDIMSAQNWFSGDPTFVGPPVANWPGFPGGGVATDSMGPAPSLAELHYWDPDVFTAQDVKELTITDDTAPSFRLNAAYAGAGRPRLAIIRTRPEPANGVGRVYLEFRDRRGWDRGLDKPGAMRTRTSVVAHVVQQNTAGVAQPFYKGQIPVPLRVDSDLQIPGSPYTVRVTYSGDGFIGLKVTLGSARGFNVESDIGLSSVKFDPDVPRVGLTPCGDELAWGRWETRTRAVFTALSWGYGGDGTDVLTGGPPPTGGSPPLVATDVTLNWVVGGQRVPELSQGPLTGCVAPEGFFDVDFYLDLQTRRLTLRSHYGDTFVMPVRAELTDNGLGLTDARDLQFPAPGSYIGYSPDDLAKIVRCGAKLASVLTIDPEAFTLPDGSGPHPNWREQILHRIETLRVERPEAGATLDQVINLVEVASGLHLTVERDAGITS